MKSAAGWYIWLKHCMLPRHSDNAAFALKLQGVKKEPDGGRFKGFRKGSSLDEVKDGFAPAHQLPAGRSRNWLARALV